MEVTMQTTTSLAQLRRKAYLSYHQDGILDLCVGAMILSIGIWRLTGIVVFGSLSWLSFSLYIGLKRTVTIPRFGYAAFSESKRKTQITVAILVVFLLVLGIGALFFLGRPGQLPPATVTFIRKFHEFVIMGMGALTMILFGSWLGIRRLAGYGISMLIFFWIAIEVGWRADLVIISIGSIIMLIGATLLARFLSRYPAQPNEAENAL
jgi:hypothetical protein